jgi:hypothetical protein
MLWLISDLFPGIFLFQSQPEYLLIWLWPLQLICSRYVLVLQTWLRTRQLGRRTQNDATAGGMCSPLTTSGIIFRLSEAREPQDWGWAHTRPDILLLWRCKITRSTRVGGETLIYFALRPEFPHVVPNDAAAHPENQCPCLPNKRGHPFSCRSRTWRFAQIKENERS